MLVCCSECISIPAVPRAPFRGRGELRRTPSVDSAPLTILVAGPGRAGSPAGARSR